MKINRKVIKIEKLFNKIAKNSVNRSERRHQQLKVFLSAYSDLKLTKIPSELTLNESKELYFRLIRKTIISLRIKGTTDTNPEWTDRRR